MKKVQQGFTLIELMIVVAIIGILAAIAIPQYQDYVTRTKLSKVPVAVASLKTAIAMFAQENAGLGTITANPWTSLGLTDAPTETTEVTNIAVAATTGTISLNMRGIGSGYDGQAVSFEPVVGSTSVTWTVRCANFADAAAKPNMVKAIGCSAATP